MLRFIYILIPCIAFGCSHTSIQSTHYFKQVQPFNTHYNTDTLREYPAFKDHGTARGALHLSEASGLANSKLNARGIWTHNDSGNRNRIYLIDKRTAKKLAVYHIAGTKNIDWEDIEVGPGPVKGQPYIYLSDTGDNDLNRSNYVIYRFPEPQYTPDEKGTLVNYKKKVDTLHISYPGKKHHNVEALMIDKRYKDLYLISKFGSKSKVYVAPYPQETHKTNHLTLIGTFPFREVTAADVSPNNKEVVIKNYKKIFYWKKPAGKRIAQILMKIPKRLPYNPVEPQGEAITIDKTGFYTTSELKNSVTPQLYFYKSR